MNEEIVQRELERLKKYTERKEPLSYFSWQSNIAYCARFKGGCIGQEDAQEILRRLKDGKTN